MVASQLAWNLRVGATVKLGVSKPPPMGRPSTIVSWRCRCRALSSSAFIIGSSVAPRTTLKCLNQAHQLPTYKDQMVLQVREGTVHQLKWQRAMLWVDQNGICWRCFLSNNNSWKMHSTFCSIRLWTLNMLARCRRWHRIQLTLAWSQMSMHSITLRINMPRTCHQTQWWAII